MKGAGITFENVRTAVEKLLAEGRQVNVRMVRAELGAGSMSAISKHLCRIGSGGI